MIEYKIGNALEPEEKNPKYLIHVCNNVGGFGSGFAYFVSKKWPFVQSAFFENFEQCKLSKLGDIQIIQIEPGFSIVNMIAQEGIGWSKGRPPIRYEALKTCLIKVAEMAKKENACLIGPRFGSKRSGGSWVIIERLILDACKDVPVYIYDLPEDQRED